MKTSSRHTLRGAAAGTGAAVLMTVGIATATAHVHVDPDTTDAASAAQLTFAVSHGCEGSPTTQMTFTLPEEINDATPTAKANWEVEKVTETLDEPKTLDNGSTITERVSQIVYTAEEPLPDGVRDTFVLGVDLPDAAGETLAFPTLQTCESGETDWNQVPEQGQDAHALESPAPSIDITEATGDSGHGGTDDGGQSGTDDGGQSAEAAADSAAMDAEAAGSSGSVVGWIGLVAGLLGLAAGGTALARTRKSRARTS